MDEEHFITTQTKQDSAISEELKAANEQFEREHYKKPIAELVGFENFGMGVGNYIKAISEDDKENVVSYGNSVADSVFTGIATLGKLIAYSDLDEVNASDVGFLITMLAELGSNAALHARETAFIQKRIEELAGN